MNKEKLLKSVQPIFDKFENLQALPITSWGRYYKYELAGEPFETDDYQFADYRSMVEGKQFDWDLLSEIDNHKDDFVICSIEDIEWPSRKECVNEYDTDTRGGTLLFVKRKGKELILETMDCDSPE